MVRRVLYTALAAVLLGASGLVWSPSALAYGDGADHDMWQVGLSFNCNNPDLCGEEIGGFWGWVEFDRSADGTQTWGDAKLSGCSHTVGGGGFAGAVSISVEVESWTIEPGSAGPQTFFASGEETDRFRGSTDTFDIVDEDTGIPAVPGHYSTSELLGFSAPGVAVQIQVAFRPAK
jgi:hypothetical protein